MARAKLPPLGAKLWGGPNFETVYHVRARVDDRVVLRWWSKRRAAWQYKIESDFAFGAALGSYRKKAPAKGKSE